MKPADRLLPAPSTIPSQRELLVAAAPIGAAAGGSILLTLLATGMIGRYSTDSLAGVALGGTIFVVLAAPLTGLFVAHQVKAARLVGAGLHRRARRFTARVVRLGALSLFAAASLIAVTASWLDPVRGSSASEAVMFILGRSPSLPLTFVSTVAANYLYVLGRRRAPLTLLLANALILVPVGYVLIYHLDLGALGDGIATSIAALAGTILILVQARRSDRDLPLESESAAATYRERVSTAAGQSFMDIGRPLMVSNTLDQFGTLAISILLSFSSTSATAAFRVGINLQSILFLVLNAASVAVITLYSSRIAIADAERGLAKKRLREVHVTGALIAVGLCTALAAAFAIAGTNDDSVRRALAFVGVSAIVSVPLCAISMYYVSLIRIRGTTWDDAKSNIVAVWLVLVPLSVALAASIGPEGACSAYVGYWACRAALARRSVLRERTNSPDAVPKSR